MSTGGITQPPVQEPFEGMPPIEGPPDAEEAKVRDQVAFGRFLKSEIYDIFGEYDLDELTDAEKEWMQPKNIRNILFRTGFDSVSVVDGTALNGLEYKLIARSPKKLAETAFTNALAIDDVTEERLETAERSGTHALEAKLLQMSSHHNDLKGYLDEILDLTGEARKPGYAHKTNETMKLLFNRAWTEFKTMLEVVHIQRNWSDETRHRAEAALMFYLTRGSQRDRVKHWQVMLSLSSAYLRNRIGLFENRIGQVSDMLSPDHDDVQV